MKGVLLGGGRATRMMPASRVMNKGLMPIYTKTGTFPQILYPLWTLINSGITDILVTSSREHCGDIIEFLGDGEEFGCNLTYRIQEMSRTITGIAQALKLAEPFVGRDRFAVILGDNYFEDTFEKEVIQFEKDKKNDCYLFLKKVDDPERFGVATIDRRGKIIEIEEKPKNPKSELAVTGLYFYNNTVFDITRDLVPSNRNELEITDVNNYYVNNEISKGKILNNHWQDMGQPNSARQLINFLWEKE